MGNEIRKKRLIRDIFFNGKVDDVERAAVELGVDLESKINVGSFVDGWREIELDPNLTAESKAAMTDELLKDLSPEDLFSVFKEIEMRYRIATKRLDDLQDSAV